MDGMKLEIHIVISGVPEDVLDTIGEMIREIATVMGREGEVEAVISMTGAGDEKAA